MLVANTKIETQHVEFSERLCNSDKKTLFDVVKVRVQNLGSTCRAERLCSVTTTPLVEIYTMHRVIIEKLIPREVKAAPHHGLSVVLLKYLILYQKISASVYFKNFVINS
jgi:hypothetical protein